MDCKHVVAVNDTYCSSALLEEAILLLRRVLKLECPLILPADLHKHPEAEVVLLPFFEGEVYERVVKVGKPVIGPAGMIFLIKEEVLLPRRLKNGQNMYSLSLHGARVCCSNVDKETREQLYRLVVAMGGTTSPALTSEVTHLVVDEVGSKKYRYAAKLGIPIMSPEWIKSIWQMSKSQVVKNSLQLMEQYKCPCFRGFTVCVTGLDHAQRTEVEHLATKHGGAYNGDLVMEKCTHLLVDNPEGQKFTFAQKWKIPCVKSKWFYDSIAKGLCLDIEEYKHVTTNKENMSISDASYLARPLLEETRDCVNTSTISTQSDVLRQLAQLDLTLNKDKGYLDGCRIFLSGFNSTEYDILRKILNNGGGMRLDGISARVTHIVTNTNVIRELEQLRVKQPEAAVVSLQWLIDSMQKGTKQPDTTYNLLPTTDLTDANPLPNIRPLAFNKTTISTLNNTKDTIIDQYTEREDVTMATDDVTMATDDVTLAPSNVTIKTDVTNNFTTTVQRTTEAIFDGYVFHVASNINVKIAKNVQQQIITNGGSCRAENVDFCVVDPFSEPPAYCTDKTLVTYMWLQRCIQSQEMLSLKACILFTPRPVPRNSDILKGCVISYTQFAGYELAHMVKLIEALGGLPQGTFSHKVINSSKRLGDCLACTHLVHKSKDSKKHAAALNWKLPSTTIDWLFACLQTLSRVDTAPYEDLAAIRKRENKGYKQARDIIQSVMPRDVAGVKVSSKGRVHTYDAEGFKTPVKIHDKNNIRLKVDSVLKALESPAPATPEDNDTSLGSLGDLYKKNLAAALKRTTPPPKILAGVTLVVKQNKTIEVPVKEVHSAARRNGALVKNMIDRSCTHVVCGVKETKESNIEQAVKRGVQVVSCYWVMASDEQGTRLPEQNFYPGVDPKRSLDMSISEDIQLPAVDINNTVQTDTEHTDKPPPEDSLALDDGLQKEINMLEKLQSRTSCDSSGEFAHPGTPRSAARNRHKRSMIRKMPPLSIPVEQLLSQKPLSVTYEDGQADRKAFLEKEARRSDTSTAPSPADKPPVTPDPATVESDKVDGSKLAADVTKLPADVTTNVPDDTLNSSRAPNMAHLAPTSSSTPNKPPDKPATEPITPNPLEGIDMDDLEITDLSIDKSTEHPVVVPPKQYKFLMTGMNVQEKVEFGGLIVELGGEVLNSNGFDPTCTHLIVAKPNRNEKYLASVGAGIWVLHPSYLSSSRNKGTWDDEQPFLWSKFTDDVRGIQKSLALSSSLWIGRKAFSDWNVMFCVASSKVNNFKGIIEAGGGTVSQTQPPYFVRSGLTHAFIDISSNNTLSSDIPLRALVEANVICVKVEYIPEHLTSGGSGEKLNNFIVEPARTLMKATSTKRSSDTSLHGTPSKRAKK